MQQLLIGGIAAFVVAAVCGKFFIPVLHRLKFGQEIREEGPKWHEKKSGTPTMGGFIFIVGILAGLILVYALSGILNIEAPSILEIGMLTVVMLAYAAIGFVDDYIKVILKRNLGLTASQKFGLQFLVALAFVSWAVFGGYITTWIRIPFTQLAWDLGWFFIPFAVLVILATVNSVNLTDGLDGLATCVTMTVAVFYLLITTIGKFPNPAVALFAAVLLGGLAGFLIYNKFPAKVFMGDTGSLCLGGAVCGMAILLEEPLALLIVGFIYVIESLSVIMQVTSYKLTGKRIFKMSPIHHHFEMCGWSEKKIVAVFTLITAALCALMYFFG
ncbi:phospho-N-acetylmuramoyl-pentapeptide-transferase [Ructibacterium gallinarum]|uniref:Phospho-N-acetylmuramoyl-pentapeptide-transferase n=1 Tax=Ructibacterium gallinarum TaxID=2779355 RepID=A0A9D5M0E0_9FIRM|nr:phospho-N-acetylmuramoyl-pentapeptide-transferase [Ructibacterium gallinarum]MBE5039960.1 phospho-N-acetylmuramoyl-pentapeptide-transferase [Ructibacterium gallinarum]